MRLGRRYGLCAAQKTEIWRRWKAGESLHEIGRALQCFAPIRLRQLQKRFRPSADWTASAGGKLLEGLAERQAGHPTLAHRATGLLLMAFFIYLLAAAIGRLMH